MCELSRPQLIAWIDGELEEAESVAVAAHVKRCAACRGEVRQLRALSSEIGEYSRAAAGGSARRSPWWIAGAAAAIVLLAASVWWIRPAPAPAGPAVTRVERAKPAVALPPLGMAAAPAAPKRAPVRRAARSVPAPAYPNEPGVPVAIPLDELLPVGAAPPGAMLVGRLTLGAAGQPVRLQIQ